MNDLKCDCECHACKCATKCTRHVVHCARCAYSLVEQTLANYLQPEYCRIATDKVFDVLYGEEC